MRKLTKDDIANQLIGRDIELIGEYKNSRTKTLFRCSVGHEWIAPWSSVCRYGCPHCAGNFPLTKNGINERYLAEARGITMIGEYTRGHAKTHHRCSHGHDWSASPLSVLGGSGCPVCSDTTLSKDIINERYIADGKGIELIGEYIRVLSKTLHRCSLGHTWSVRPSDVLGGSGCPRCATSGFKVDKPATIYLLDFGHFIKYGISNNPNRRLTEHRRYMAHAVVMTVECDGNIAAAWEKMVKTEFGGRFVDKTVLPDGHTETLSSDYSQAIISTMMSIKNSINQSNIY